MHASASQPADPGDLAEISDTETEAEPEPEPELEPEPANRAARRGRARKQVPPSARHDGSAGHARPAQGRRIIPVRRTG